MLKILWYALSIIIAVVIMALPVIIGWIFSEMMDNGWIMLISMLVGYSLLFGIWMVHEENEMSGTAEVIGMEYIPVHEKSSVRTQPVIIGGKTSIMTMPTSEIKDEAYTIHVRQKSDDNYKRLHLEVSEAEYNSFELGDEINLEDFSKYN